MAIQVDVSNQDETTVVAVTGAVDGGSAPGLQTQLLPLLQPGGALVLTLGGVNYMSSAGLRVLLLLYRQAMTGKGRVVLAGLAESIKDTMTITGFLKFFTVADNVEQALVALRRG